MFLELGVFLRCFADRSLCIYDARMIETSLDQCHGGTSVGFCAPRKFYTGANPASELSNEKSSRLHDKINQ